MGRTFVALIIAPVIGGLAYVLAASLTFGSAFFAHAPALGGPPVADNGFFSAFLAAVVVAVVFEVLLLLPSAYLLRRHARFVLNIAVFGTACWIVLSAGWFVVIFGQDALSAAINCTQLLALGVPLVLAFATIARKGLHA